MRVGYIRVSAADPTRREALQADALRLAGASRVFTDHATGSRQPRTELARALRCLSPGDQLIVWRADRLARSCMDLVNIIGDCADRGIALRILAGDGCPLASDDARTLKDLAQVLSGLERQIVEERTDAALASAQARGRLGGRPRTMTAAKLRLAQAAMRAGDSSASETCSQLGISRATLYRYVDGRGALTVHGRDLLAATSTTTRIRTPA